MRPDPSLTPPPDDAAARRPRSFAQRLGLLTILLVLPVAVLTLPTLMITHFFGRRPRAKKPVAVDTSGLREQLDLKADRLLPTPAPLVAEPIRISVLDPTHVEPRTEKIKAQAQRFGGSAVEGIAADGEKHLFVDLPAGATDAFRSSVLSGAPGQTPVLPPPRSIVNAARDQVEVFIRAAGKDE